MTLVELGAFGLVNRRGHLEFVAELRGIRPHGSDSSGFANSCGFAVVRFLSLVPVGSPPDGLANSGRRLIHQPCVRRTYSVNLSNRERKTYLSIAYSAEAPKRLGQQNPLDCLVNIDNPDTINLADHARDYRRSRAAHLAGIMAHGVEPFGAR
jgi:hypothetical protein